MLQRLRAKMNGMLVSGKQFLTTRLVTTLREYAESKLAEQSEQLRLPKFGAHDLDARPHSDFGHNEEAQQTLHNALDVLKDAPGAKPGFKGASDASFQDVHRDHRGHGFGPDHLSIFDRTISQALRQRSSLHDTQLSQRKTIDLRPLVGEQSTSTSDLEYDNTALLPDPDAEIQPDDDQSLRQEVVKLCQKNILHEAELLKSQQDLRLLRLHAIGLEDRLASTQHFLASLRDHIQQISQVQDEMSKKLHTIEDHAGKTPSESQSKLAFVLSWKHRNRKGGA
ncbi:hypothetical protein E4T39_04141 [Aureobasidium subglaciale]|nr:hypothetical protein E4T39_04141 [Aureobasidium subglaciale]